MQTAKAVYPIRVGGKVLKPGADLDEAAVGRLRLERLVAKGRATIGVERAQVNRAEFQTGKPALKLPENGRPDND